METTTKRARTFRLYVSLSTPEGVGGISGTIVTATEEGARAIITCLEANAIAAGKLRPFYFHLTEERELDLGTPGLAAE